MAELRLIGVSADGRHLRLTDAYGTEHALLIDDRLRAAVNGQLSRLGQLTMALESRISPREIQERVRRGESAEEVAASADVPLERVLRFVGPVLREREYVAERARRARVGPADGPSVLLEDLVARQAERLRLDPEDVVWDSARREDHTWEVRVRWPDGTTAVWALDVAHQHASPVDAVAARLSGREPLPQPEPEESATVHPLIRLVERTAEAEPADPQLRAGDDVADSPRGVAPQAATERGPSQGTGLSSNRSEDDRGVVERSPRPDTTERPAEKAPPRGRRRAQVPKWDDIIFGMKPKAE